MGFASIIICAHNHLADLSIPCINSVLSGTSYPYELILVDDGSTDGTARYFSTVTDKSFRLSKRGGQSRARNVGLKNAAGDLIISLDNDVFVPDGWLNILAEESQKANVGIIGAIPSNETERLNAQPSQDGLLDFPHVSGACMGITRACFMAVGFYDENIEDHDDTDYCYRALLAGFRVANTPRLVVPHLAGGTRRGLGSRRIERSARRFRNKYIQYQNILPMPPLYPFG